MSDQEPDCRLEIWNCISKSFDLAEMYFHKPAGTFIVTYPKRPGDDSELTVIELTEEDRKQLVFNEKTRRLRMLHKSMYGERPPEEFIDPALRG